MKKRGLHSFFVSSAVAFILMECIIHPLRLLRMSSMFSKMKIQGKHSRRKSEAKLYQRRQCQQTTQSLAHQK